jgi:hypothetical protein
VTCIANKLQLLTIVKLIFYLIHLTYSIFLMKKLIIIFLIPAFIMLVKSAAYAQGITTPRTPSPGAIVSQTIGISTITVKYSRPSVKGREVWGGLVPYGWRTMARRCK